MQESFYITSVIDSLLNLKLNSSVIYSYYTKSNIDNILTILSNNHYTKSVSDINYYYKSQVDTLLGTKPNTEIVAQQINLKADIVNVYTKTQIDNFINPLAISTNYYDKATIDARRYLKLTDLFSNLENYYYKDSNEDETIKYLDIGKFRFAASNDKLLIQQLDDIGVVISDSYMNILDISLDVNTKLSTFNK